MNGKLDRAGMLKAFHDAPYRVYHGLSIRTFDDAADAMAFAGQVDGEAYAGTATDMLAGTSFHLGRDDA